jgi:hypothetical protein
MNKELKLDFSGGPGSWFDLWHTHVDWDGKGNKDWKTRKKYLREILEMFDEFKRDLQTYPYDFQLWIIVDENDSAQDSVYIHTKNPNVENFPIKLKADGENGIKDQRLKKFVDSLAFERVRVRTNGGDIYYLFAKGTGISLV